MHSFSQAITLTNAQPLKVTLGEDTQVLDEVVVTALGIFGKSIDI